MVAAKVVKSFFMSIPLKVAKGYSRTLICLGEIAHRAKMIKNININKEWIEKKHTETDAECGCIRKEGWPMF